MTDEQKVKQRRPDAREDVDDLYGSVSICGDHGEELSRAFSGPMASRAACADAAKRLEGDAQ